MKWMKIMIFLFIGYSGFAQIYQPKSIKVKGNYTHKSGMVFPGNFGELILAEVMALDQEKKHIRVVYEGMLGNNETKVSVFLYPNERTFLATLKNEYTNSLKAIAQHEIKEIVMFTKAIAFNKNGYTLHGLSGLSGLNMNKREGLTVFECGKWMLKIRVTSGGISDESWKSFHKEFLELINPTLLVEDRPWHPESYQLVFETKILSDSIFISCLIIGASTHALWIEKNVDLLERRAGLPGLHLKGHSVAYKLINETWKFMKEKDDNLKHKFLDELERIVESGFLNEFIMEQFQNNLIVSDDVTLYVDKFQEWKRDNPINIDLKDTFYTIMYLR